MVQALGRHLQGKGRMGEGTQLWEVSDLQGPKSEVSFRCVCGGEARV